MKPASITRGMPSRQFQPLNGFAKLADLGFVTGVGTLGIVPNLPGFEYVPGISLNNFSIGVNTQRRKQANNTWHATENFSKIEGRHTMKFGGEFRYYQINDRNLCAPNGLFTFDGSETGTDFIDYLLVSCHRNLQSNSGPSASKMQEAGCVGDDLNKRCC